ncbi:MAG TPA: c-type cytochrome, partial [Verrucomicrobiae bacterium]|nr:c-type cytochrome [Verrucomicrobiae bacterium]
MRSVAGMLFWMFAAVFPLQAAESETPFDRGRILYLANCLICHQINGLGTPGVFPPLAQSDFLTANPRKAVLAVVEGLAESLVVNGRKYNGTMPPVNLDDQQVSDVFSFILGSWGNNGKAPDASEIKAIRARSKFPSYADLVRANSFAPLPSPPDGWQLREVIRLPEHGIRIVPSGDQEGMYLLGGTGNVWHLNPVTGALAQILWGKNYLDKKGAATSTWGLALDQVHHRFFIVANRRDESGALVTNYVTIYRSTTIEEGHPAQPQPWFQTSYPWGVGPFNHSVNHLAIGPDGLLYVNSGSRTDGNEPGEAANYWKGGEHPITACLWRLDPQSDQPKLEIYARGLRNAFGFCWNKKGEL